MSYPKDYRYSKEHEWVNAAAPDAVVVGITRYAIDSLGDVVFVDLPSVGDTIEQYGSIGEIESVKAVSDLYSPVGGEVVEVNQSVLSDQAQINADPFGDGWLIKVKCSDISQLDALMSVDEYLKFIDNLS